MRTLQVFEDNILPEDVHDYMSELYTVSNDQYIRFYPNRNQYAGDFHERALSALILGGLYYPVDDEYFCVLIHFSW